MDKSANYRILFIVQELMLGGAGYLAIKWIRKLISLYDIDILILGPYENKMLAELPESVPVYTLERSLFKSALYRLGSGSPLGAVPFFMERGEILPLKKNYRAILGTSILGNWRACLAFSLAQAPQKIIFLVDEALAPYIQESTLKRNMIDLSLLTAGHIVSVSRSLFESMAIQCVSLKSKPFQVIWPIVEMNSNPSLNETDWLPQDKPIVLTVARLSPGKQILESLYIHHELMKAGVDFRWYIVGEGPQETLLRSEIKRLDMCESFILAGFQSNVAHWMNQCDIFALFSVSEGCPTVIIEALQLNCVVISTLVHGVDELLVNEQTGLIVSNRPDDIKQQLSRLILDANLRGSIKNNLMRQPLKPTADADVQRLIKLIEEPHQKDKQSKNEQPIVSILIPTYNQGAWLDRAVSSALMQDFYALEVVVVDDASSDNTEENCSKWLADRRFRYVKNPSNLGRVQNYRHALCNHARGDWVLMLDGDDYLVDPGFIKAAWDAVQRHAHKGVLFAQGGHKVRHCQASLPDVDILPKIGVDELVVVAGDYLKFVFATGFFTHLGILYNRLAAIKYNCYTNNISSSDMDSFLKLSLQGSVVLLNRVAGCWVQHDSNASSNLPIDLVTENVKIFRDIANLAIKEGLASRYEINPVLTRYEAQTLAFLYAQTIGKTTHHPFATFKLIPIIIAINPKLLFNFKIIKAGVRSFIKLLILFIKKRGSK